MRLFRRSDAALPQEHRLEVSVDYHQFSLTDEAALGDETHAWEREGAVDDMVDVERGCLHVGTARNADVPLELVFAQAEPALDLAGWEHAVECSVELPTGRVGVGFHDLRRFTVPPGTYRVVVLARGLDTVDDHDLEGDDEYRVVLWPGEARPVRILKDSRRERL